MRKDLLLAVALMAGLASCRAAPPDFDAVGTLERRRVDLIAEAPEPIAAIEVREGESVESGQLVLRQDETRLAAEVARAVAVRARASALFAELENGPRHEDIAAARARLAGAEATLQRQRLELERARQLRGRDIVAAAELDATRAAYEEAQALRDQADAALAALLAGTRVEQIDQARAALAEAEAAVEALRVHLDRLQVHAPVRGRIDSLPYELGERPPQGAVVAVLLAEEAPYARVYVPEATRVAVRTGSAATVWVDGLAGELRGRVRTVAAEPSFTPFYALTERDRGRLVYVAEIDLLDARARDLPAGVPLQVRFSAPAASESDRDG